MEHEKQQVIITIGREYGSGGHLIADMLGEKYGLPVYDSTIIEVIAKEKNLNLEKLKEYDEKPRNRLFTRSIDGYSNSRRMSLPIWNLTSCGRRRNPARALLWWDAAAALS